MKGGGWMTRPPRLIHAERLYLEKLKMKGNETQQCASGDPQAMGVHTHGGLVEHLAMS